MILFGHRFGFSCIPLLRFPYSGALVTEAQLLTLSHYCGARVTEAPLLTYPITEFSIHERSCD